VTRIHQAAAAFFCVLPLIGLASGRGGPTFSMYASSCWFRIAIIARDAEGRPYDVAPTDLARRASPSARPFLAGGDHFRRTYDTSALRRHAGDLGRAACAMERARAATITITLFERDGRDEHDGRDATDGAVRETRAIVSCRP
jgi:hypothetical protein